MERWGRTADWQGCCDDEPKYCSRGTTATGPTRLYLTVVFGLFGGLRPSPASRSPAPSPLAAAARDSTRASCTRAPSKQKQRRRAERGRALAGPRALSPSQLARHDRAPPPGRGREGRGHHPVYRPAPAPAPALSRKRSPGSGRVSAHPPAARPCVGRERGPRRLRVTPVTTLATHFAPGLQLPSERLRTPLTWPPPPCHADPSEPWLRTLALRSLVPTPPRTSPASDHPTHTFRPGRAREGVDGSKLSEAYSVCHMTKLALVLATHAAASLRAETDILGGGVLSWFFSWF